MKAEINLIREYDDRVFIADANNGKMSITNDAEGVVAFVSRHWPHLRIVYRDTEGQWDELLHDGHGKFTGFAPYKEHTPG